LDVASNSRYVRLTLDNNSSGANQYSLHSIGDGDSSNGSFGIYNDTGSAWVLKIDANGKSTQLGEATFGPGGTGTDVVNIIADGGTGTAGGATFEIRSNGTYRGGLGNKAALFGSTTSTDIHLRAASGNAIVLAPNNVDSLTLAADGTRAFEGDYLTNFEGDVLLAHDGAVLKFGANSDVLATHVHDVGLDFSSTRSGADSIFRFKNSANASASDVRLIIQNGGTDGGDPLINLDGQATNATWSVGVDTSATKFVIADADKGGFDGSDEVFTIATGGDATFAGAIDVAGAAGYIQFSSGDNSYIGSGQALIASGSDNDIAIRVDTGDSLIISEDSNNIIASFDADGLKFNADTAAANALDDYEEGTWTPTLTGATTTGSSQSYSTQEGRIYKDWQVSLRCNSYRFSVCG